MTRRAKASLGQSRFHPTCTWTPQLGVDPVAFGLERAEDLGRLVEAFFAPKDRAYDLAAVAAVAVVD